QRQSQTSPNTPFHDSSPPSLSAPWAPEPSRYSLPCTPKAPPLAGPRCQLLLEPPAELHADQFADEVVVGQAERGADTEVDRLAHHKPHAGTDIEEWPDVASPPAKTGVGVSELAIERGRQHTFDVTDELDVGAAVPQQSVVAHSPVEEVALELGV